MHLETIKIHEGLFLKKQSIRELLISAPTFLPILIIRKKIQKLKIIDFSWTPQRHKVTRQTTNLKFGETNAIQRDTANILPGAGANRAINK